MSLWVVAGAFGGLNMGMDERCYNKTRWPLVSQPAATAPPDPNAAMLKNNIMHLFLCNRTKPVHARAILQACLEQFPEKGPTP